MGPAGAGGSDDRLSRLTRSAPRTQHPEHPAPVRRVLGRSPAAGRASARLALALVGAAALTVAAVPLGLLVRSAWPPLVSLDAAATTAAERAVTDSATVLTAARVTTLAGDPTLLWLLTLAVAVGLATGQRRLAVFVLVVRLGAQLLSTGLKLVYDRARPVFDQPVDAALGAAFPSGHALGSAAVWTGLAVLALPLVGRRARSCVIAAAVLLAVLVSFSRVLLGVHFVSDVLAGLLVGAGWTALCTAVFVSWRREQGAPVESVADGVRPEPGSGR